MMTNTSTMFATNCSQLLDCSTCAITTNCAWLADVESINSVSLCVRASASAHVASPYQLFRNASACPTTISSAQLLFDPAMFVMLFSIVGALVLGARRSVASATASAAATAASSSASSSTNVTMQMQAQLRDMRLTPKRIALFLLVPLCGSAVLLLFYFFTTIVYYCLLVVTTVAGLSSLYQLLLPYCASLALRLAPQRAAVPLVVARRRVSVASVAASLLALLLVALWLSSNFWLFINLVALGVGVSALERAPIPAVRYTFLLGMLLLVYDCFWVFATILRPVDDGGMITTPAMSTPSPSTMMNFTTSISDTAMSTFSSFVTLPPTSTPTPTPTHAGESAMLRLAMGILHDSKGCELAVLALFRPCWPSLPMITVYPRWFTGGFSAVGLGDLIVPGVHIAVLARYDRWLGRTWRTGYFALGALGYTLGLILTMVVALVFRSGQPALLYLIPFVHFPTMFAAVVRRELPLYWTGRRAQAAATADDNGAGGVEASIEANAVPLATVEEVSDSANASLLANAELRE
jgi:hypothetical protein